MTYTREDLPKASVKLTVTIEPEELEIPLQNAAVKLSETMKFDGFRPGHVPFDMVKSKVGEMKLLEAALEPVIRKTVIEAVNKENLSTVGMPEIALEKVAPDNPIVYTATFALMPTVTKLGDFNKISVAKPIVDVPASKVDGTLKELQKMQAKETRVTRPATMADKVVVDFQMMKNKVAVEGGTAKDHAIFMEESYYVPGLKDQLIGMKEGEKKNFILKFPENHIQKTLAGADIEYDVTMKSVFELELPELNDEFAKSIGQPSVARVRELVAENIKAEVEADTKRKTEVELLEKLAEASEFSEIPELLVKNEVEAMFHELEHNIEERGMSFADYLRDLQKTPEGIRKDFEPQAMRRVKVALVLGKSSDELKTTVTEDDLDSALDELAAEQKDQAVKDRIYSPQYREHQRIVLRNRKTIEKLKELMVK